MSLHSNEAADHGNRLAISGLALEALADLLGHDGSEHHLSGAQVYGLACAVYAIGTSVRDQGAALCDIAEKGAAQ
ncbi:hypothetical protein [Pseudomonas turukhanskensis]|uniref:Uncharacterized protein n=1 Tax=Pseudomonas turukhanskensis TaxID=1806536 RepID=A0A9W6NGT5_9PSED|nr:hypothetical protein [Pseudomonas turukhanskensis]GLK90041.1 hypothetical protein GCM10017655_31030 [Pseudomonas turukhanskensis]